MPESWLEWEHKHYRAVGMCINKQVTSTEEDSAIPEQNQPLKGGRQGAESEAAAHARARSLEEQPASEQTASEDRCAGKAETSKISRGLSREISE